MHSSTSKKKAQIQAGLSDHVLPGVWLLVLEQWCVFGVCLWGLWTKNSGVCLESGCETSGVCLESGCENSGVCLESGCEAVEWEQRCVWRTEGSFSNQQRQPTSSAFLPMVRITSRYYCTTIHLSIYLSIYLSISLSISLSLSLWPSQVGSNGNRFVTLGFPWLNITGLTRVQCSTVISEAKPNTSLQRSLAD